MAIFKGFSCCNGNAKRREDFGRKKPDSLSDLLNLKYSRYHPVEEIWWTPGDPAGATDFSIRIAILFKGIGAEPGVVVHISYPSTQKWRLEDQRVQGQSWLHKEFHASPGYMSSCC